MYQRTLNTYFIP